MNGPEARANDAMELAAGPPQAHRPGLPITNSITVRVEIVGLIPGAESAAAEAAAQQRAAQEHAAMQQVVDDATLWRAATINLGAVAAMSGVATVSGVAGAAVGDAWEALCLTGPEVRAIGSTGKIGEVDIHWHAFVLSSGSHDFVFRRIRIAS